MSADNWGICPVCNGKQSKYFIDKKTNLIQEYGKISSEEYLGKVKAFEQERSNSRKNMSLREDYEISTDANGEFCISYGCMCAECGLEFSFNHKENIIK